MEELKDKIEFYLIFAKSKLNPKYIGHKEAREEIDEILKEINQIDNSIEKILEELSDNK